MNPSCNRLSLWLRDHCSSGVPPELDPELTAHVMACADCAELLDGERALDELLGGAPAEQVDPRLVTSVLGAIRTRLDAGLEGALKAWEVPPPPADLTARVLAAVRLEQQEELADVELQPVRGTGWFRPGAVLAAAAALILITVRPWEDGLEETPADPELLAWLDVLERWDAIETLDPLERDALAALDPADVLLLQTEVGR